jgi:hypothetical protein
MRSLCAGQYQCSCESHLSVGDRDVLFAEGHAFGKVHRPVGGLKRDTGDVSLDVPDKAKLQLGGELHVESWPHHKLVVRDWEQASDDP